MRLLKNARCCDASVRAARRADVRLTTRTRAGHFAWLSGYRRAVAL